MLKLFVLGVTSPNPDDWEQWSGYTLVLAENAEQAVELAGSVAFQPAIEVDTSKPAVLSHHDMIDLVGLWRD